MHCIQQMWHGFAAPWEFTCPHLLTLLIGCYIGNYVVMSSPHNSSAQCFGKFGMQEINLVLRIRISCHRLSPAMLQGSYVISTKLITDLPLKLNQSQL